MRQISHFTPQYMIINIHSDIETLRTTRVLCNSAAYVCESIGLTTLGSILSVSVRTIRRERHCTPKTILQFALLHYFFSKGRIDMESAEFVDTFQNLSSEQVSDLRKNYMQNPIKLTERQMNPEGYRVSGLNHLLKQSYNKIQNGFTDDVKDFFNSLYPDVQLFLWEVSKSRPYILNPKQGCEDAIVKVELRRLATMILEDVLNEIGLKDTDRERIQNVIVNLKRKAPLVDALDKYSGLHSTERRQLDFLRGELFSEKRLMENRVYHSYDDTETTLYALYSFDNPEISLSDSFADYLRKFKSIFEAVCAKFYLPKEENVCSYEIIYSDLRYTYKFLSNGECERIAADMAAGTPKPYIYIYLKAFLRHRERNTAIHRDFMGFNRERKPLSKYELAEKYELQPERIRQILMKAFGPAWMGQEFIDKMYSSMGIHRPFVVISDMDKRMKEWLANNHLNLSPIELLRLIHTTNRCMELVETPNEHCYLIKGNNSYGASILGCYAQMDKLLKKKRTAREKVNFLQIFQHNNRGFDNNDKTRELSKIFEEAFCDGIRARVESYLEYTLLPNEIDRPAELRQILSENGNPMSAKDIRRRFYERFPEMPYATLDVIQRELRSNEDVVGKGLTGFYSLKSWGNQYCGTITGLLHKTLEENPAPMTLDALTAIASAEFPTTSTRSVASLLSREIPTRFVGFEDKHYGLAGKSYHSKYKLSALTIRKTKEVETA